jgi:signal peptidase I
MNNELNKKVTRIIFAFVLVWSFAVYQNALELKKEREWSFDREVQFYILERVAPAADDVTKRYSLQKKSSHENKTSTNNSIEGKLHVWLGKTLYEYSENTEKKIKFKMRKGEGPGDCLIVNKIAYYDGQYVVWDRRLKRMTYFSEEGKLIGTERFKTLLFPALVGKTGDNYIFKWNIFEGRRSSRFITEQVVMVNGKKKEDQKVLAAYTGKLNKGEVGNFDRPSLLHSLSGKKFYYAKNLEYKIYVMDLNKPEPAPSLFIAKENKPLKWEKKYEDLQWEISRKPRRKTELNYPPYVPPLFAIAASGDLLAAVTNEQVGKRKSVIDIFRRGKYLGSAAIPLLYEQYFIFPTFLNLPTNVYLSDHSLYTLHYFDDLEVYKIIKWRIDL